MRNRLRAPLRSVLKLRLYEHAHRILPDRVVPARQPESQGHAPDRPVSGLSNDTKHTNEILSNVVAFVEKSRDDLELLDYETEIIAGL